MRESVIETYLCDQVREVLKGNAYKFSSPGRRAVPDRLCVIDGYCFFVECKATGEELTDAQRREADRLNELDQWVCMVNSKKKIDLIILFWKTKLICEERL